jgi:hypothetical protein
MKINEEYLPETFAVKIVRAEDEEKRNAHEKEFEILLKLEHRNIVKAIEIFRNTQRKEVF